MVQIMGIFDHNSASLNATEADLCLQGSQVDTHFSSGFSSALEMDELLLEADEWCETESVIHSEDFIYHCGLALRLGILQEDH